MNPSSGETPVTSQPAPVPAPARAMAPAGQKRTGSDDTSTTASTVPPMSDDHDKVEKEWVGKVKRIIQKTRHDPYQQSEDLTALKADYMRQRYNKIIKVEK